MSTVNEQYRNSVFCEYFSNQRRLLSLCNAVLGTDYFDPDDVIINTLEGTFFNAQKNDISCQIGKHFLVLIEHQSSINANMPFRCLSYVSELMNNLVTNKNRLYRKPLIKFPSPKFFVLYDGNDAEPLVREMRLSDAFDDSQPSLELRLTSFNINYGMPQPLLDRCSYLRQYSMLVGKVKEGIRLQLDLHHSISRAVKFCIDNNIMRDFLIQQGKEVFNMIELQWNLEDAQRAWYLDGKDDGLTEGFNLKAEQIALKMLERNKSFEEIRDLTELPMERILSLASSSKTKKIGEKQQQLDLS